MTKECMEEGELKHRVEVRVGGGGLMIHQVSTFHQETT